MLGHLQTCQHLNHRDATRRKGRARKWKLIWKKKIMEENFPNLVKEIDIQVQEAERVPNKLDPKRTTPRHVIIKIPKVKDKDRISKAAREKQSYVQRSSHKTISRFLKRNCKQERTGKNYSKWQKARTYSLDYPAKLSFRMEGQIKSFPDKVKLKEFIITKPLLYEMLETWSKPCTLKRQQVHNYQQLNIKKNPTKTN